MSPYLKRLCELIPPPENPVAPGTPEQWRAYERALGARFPESFKQYLATYGSGGFEQELFVLSPFSEDIRDYRIRYRGECEFANARHSSEVAPFPFRSFPGANTILPVGHDCGGLCVALITSDGMTFDRVILSSGEFLEFELYGEDIAEMLLEVVDGSLHRLGSWAINPEDDFEYRTFYPW